MRIGVNCSYSPMDTAAKFGSLPARAGYVSLTFYERELFEAFDVEEVAAAVKEAGLEVLSIHLPSEKVTRERFSPYLKKSAELARRVGCDKLVVHPGMESLSLAEPILKRDIVPLLESEKIWLCWETFSSKKRLFPGMECIADWCGRAPYQAACYDFSHVRRKTDEMIYDFNKYGSHIRMLHVSNWSGNVQHLPIHHADGEIDCTRALHAAIAACPDADAVLEYLPEYYAQSIEDALALRKL